MVAPFFVVRVVGVLDIALVRARAALETFGLVHEHKYVMTRTPHVRWQKLRKKVRCGSWVVVPITMAATPAAFAAAAVALQLRRRQAPRSPR